MPSGTLLLRLEWLQERLVASVSAKESSALAPISPAKRELPLRAQAPPLNRLQLSVNHSLCATAATALFKADVPEKVIQERTGHRSLDALRKYERSTERQHGAASKILAIRNEVDYQKALCSVASEKASTGSSTARTASLPITLNIQSMSGCTINLSYGPPPESTQEDPVALPELSEKEVEELFSDF